MKKKSLIATAAAVSLVGVVGIGATLAYFTDKTDEKSNIVTFGHVNIEINETSHPIPDQRIVVGAENDDKTGYVYNAVMPGDRVSKDVIINKTDDSADCYIRAKVNFKVGDKIVTNNIEAPDYIADIAQLQTNVRANLGPGWSYNPVDGYYYYSPILTADDITTLDVDESKATSIFAGGTFTIPTAWGNEAADQGFEIDIQAEAIQADNFTPEANGTWGSITVESYVPATP